MSRVVEKVVTVQTNSAMIAEMSYNPATLELTVTFRKGGVYKYEGVPEYLFQNMIAESNDSIGKYFHANIRRYPTLYPYTRLDS